MSLCLRCALQVTCQFGAVVPGPVSVAVHAVAVMDDGRKAKAKHSVHLALRDDFFKPSTLGSCIRVRETQQVRDSLTGADVQHVLTTQGNTIPEDGIEICKTRTWSSVMRVGPLESYEGDGCQAVTFESCVDAVPSSGYQTPLKSTGVVEVHSKGCKQQDDEDGSEDHKKTYKGSDSDYTSGQHEEYDSGDSSYWKGENMGDKKHKKTDSHPQDSYKTKDKPHVKKDTDSYKQKKDTYSSKDSYSGLTDDPKYGADDGEGYDGPDEQYVGSGNGGGGSGSGIPPIPGTEYIPPLPGSYGSGIPPLPGSGPSGSSGIPPLPRSVGGGGSFRRGEAPDGGVELPAPDAEVVQPPIGVWLPHLKQAETGNSGSNTPTWSGDSSTNAAGDSDSSSDDAGTRNPGVWLPPIGSSGSGSFSLGESEDGEGSGEGFDDNQQVNFWKGTSKSKAPIPGLGREKLVTSSTPQPSRPGTPLPARLTNVLSPEFWVELAKASEAAVGHQTVSAAGIQGPAEPGAKPLPAAHAAVGVAAAPAAAASKPGGSTAAKPAAAAAASTAAAPAEKPAVLATAHVAAVSAAPAVAAALPTQAAVKAQ